ncbi:mRNA decapping enzyme [Sea otter poxvirus]|uniref:mRNA decapping enzyme n=1 Tax=Sea otter poxvirus TaxID=1416741 RepID=A0A2U9QHP9_9POXV|nr:mRNA decapping enzyme [Sea otter poxvirus]AWU47129.1 mRNA decapping enzyme [Sea otter poxvirus]
MDVVTFDTIREYVTIKVANTIPDIKGTRFFAICVTKDNVPIVASRRSSFAFQELMSRITTNNILHVPKNLLQFMYENELREIAGRTIGTPVNTYSKFKEIIMMGGKANKTESPSSCLRREIKEESDNSLTVSYICDTYLYVTIFDKLIKKKFECYCTLCYVDQTLNDIVNAKIFNIEVKELCPLTKCIDNDKFEYLYYIYNTLCK